MEQNNPSVFPMDKRDSVDRSNPEAVCGRTKIEEARARPRRCSSGIQEAQRWGVGGARLGGSLALPNRVLRASLGRASLGRAKLLLSRRTVNTRMLTARREPRPSEGDSPGTTEHQLGHSVVRKHLSAYVDGTTLGRLERGGRHGLKPMRRALSNSSVRMLKLGFAEW